jgi:hypothetical protein
MLFVSIHKSTISVNLDNGGCGKEVVSIVDGGSISFDNDKLSLGLIINGNGWVIAE